MKKNPSLSNWNVDNAVQSRLPLLFLISVSGVLIWRLFSFISRYAVNLLYWDQWDFFTPLFRNQNLWQMFRWQHGPHRQGMGLMVTALLANLTDWNSRADAFAVGLLVCLALFFALVLKRRLLGSWSYIDATIPFIFLTLFQYETFMNVPNLSHGAFPLLLIILYCLGLLLENRNGRYATIIGLNFLLVYTGFGVFMGLLSMLMLVIDIYQNRHQKTKIALPVFALVLVLVSNLSFFVSYRFNPAVPNFFITSSHWYWYPKFIILMLASFWGWNVSLFGLLTAYVVGAFFMVVLVAILILHGQRLLRNGIYSNRISLVIAILVGYSLLFCLNTAIGRLPLGLDAAQASRYLTLMIPAYLALYLHWLTIRTVRLRQLALSVYCAISMMGSLPLGLVEARALKIYTNKVNWKTCYLNTEDIAECDQKTHFQIYPTVDDLKIKLSYLKEHHRNLFLDADP